MDDEHERGRVTEICKRLEGEVRMQTGDAFEIFQDRTDIRWGQQWKQRIDDSLDSVSFLLVILTPSFFKRPECRRELERFLEHEQALGRNDLVLAIHYVDCRVLSDKQKCESDPLARTLGERQIVDWRDLRHEPLTDPAVGKRLAGMARQVAEALERSGLAESHDPPVAAAPSRSRRGGTDARQFGQTAGGAPAESSEPARGPAPRKEPPTLVVDPMHRGDHATVTDALRAAEPGTRILVRPGFYIEGLKIDKPVEILGDGERGEIVIEAAGKDVILFQAPMGRVANLTLRQTGGGEWYGVDIAQGRLDLEDCDIISRSLACVAIRGGADPRLRRNRIHDGNETGVSVYNNGQGTLEDNEIFANTLAGVAIKTGGNPTLRRNRIHDGKAGGVHVHDNGQGTLEDNEIFANTLAGVAIETGGNPALRRNRIHDGKQAGVMVRDNGQGTLEDNEIFANAFAGVEIGTGGNPTLRRNRIQDGKQSGLIVHDNGQGTLEDNEISGNARAGAEIKTGGNPALRRNRISGNGYEGIWVYDSGRGVFEQNDLRGNTRGAWDIAPEHEERIARTGNIE